MSEFKYDPNCKVQPSDGLGAVIVDTMKLVLVETVDAATTIKQSTVSGARAIVHFVAPVS